MIETYNMYMKLDSMAAYLSSAQSAGDPYVAPIILSRAFSSRQQYP
jgi:hypothetical protein